MKVPVSWLRELVALPLACDTQTLAQRLTNLGLTVERIYSTDPDVVGPLVIGRVLSYVDEPQKNGKTIRYCRVDVGEHNDPGSDEHPASRGIVCGAHNFEENDLVVVALPGTVLPGDFAISARKTYGHVSDGMICSELELGLGEDHAGIIVLDPATTDAEAGQSALDILWQPDEVLEMEITPDLSHALSMRGIAREAAAACQVSFKDPYPEAMPAATSAGWPVLLESERCTRFVALTIEGIDPAAPSPRYIVDRLRAAGVRSISLAVDVTNYVMLEAGQPLHAYDADKLQGAIRVRLAQDGETLRTLDGQDRQLTADDLAIVDDSGPIGMAGVMGGESTEVTDNTTTIVLEAANFEAASVSRTFRRHGLPSEASKRFERRIDPNVAWAAAHRAAELLVEHGGGHLRPEETVVGDAPDRHKLNLRSGLVSAVLGVEVPTDQVVRILETSGAAVTALGDSLTIEAPTWRPDLHDPYDIVEEVGRNFGYNKIGHSIPTPPAGRGLTGIQRNRRAVLRAVAATGFTEILSLPFISEDEIDKLGVPEDNPCRDLVRLANPLDDTHPYLRTSLLPGLFKAVARNTSRSIDDLALFERGSVYRGAGRPAAPRPSVLYRPSAEEIASLEAALPSQPELLAGVVTGNWIPGGWRGPAVPANWTHVVALAERAAASLGIGLTRENDEETMPWHPGRCARILVGDKTIGFAGELHPQVVAAWSLPKRTCAVELDLGALLAAAPGLPTFSQLSSYPLAKEDVALIVDESVPVAAVREALAEGAGELLESVALFDVYHGDQVGQGRKSLAFGLRFRADRTLTDAEAAEARDSAVALAVERFGAIQRAASQG